jgi:flagellar basal-body rod protein FlgG
LVKTSFDNLTKISNNNYKVEDNKKTTNILDNQPYLLQGTLEKSNVNSITTMVALIDSQRRLEQAQKASVGISEINQKLIDKLTR